jgi:hypothetical protein
LHAEHTDERLGQKEVLKRFFVSFAVIPFAVLPHFPNTEREHLIRFRIRDEQNLVHEPALFLQDGKCLFVLIALESSFDVAVLLVSSTKRESAAVVCFRELG